MGGIGTLVDAKRDRFRRVSDVVGRYGGPPDTNPALFDSDSRRLCRDSP